MGTPEGLAELAKQLEKEQETNAVFLLKHGWTQDGDYFVKGEHRLYDFDAVHKEMFALIRADNWREIVTEVTMPACKGQKVPDQMAYYESPKTGRIYQYLEVISLYYDQPPMTEDELYPKWCSEKTLDLNALYPGDKPEVMRLKFTLSRGYERLE
jgi:hypothetical protein